MSALSGSVLAALGSVLSAAGGDNAGGGGSGVTQLIAGAGISLNPVGGTGVVTISSTFGGFGTAPPAIASTSAAGSASTASRSNHTHALDVVAYTPSLSAMQRTGVVQQSFASTTATPSVLTMNTNAIPFGDGAGSGALTQQTRIFAGVLSPFANNNAIVVNNEAGSATAALLKTNSAFLTQAVGQLTTIMESGQSNVGFRASNYSNAAAQSSTAGSLIRLLRAQGSFAAPGAVVSQHAIGRWENSAYDGTQFSVAGRLVFWVDQVVANTSASAYATLTLNSTLNPLGATNHFWTLAGDFGATGTVATNATAGFLWHTSMAGAPTGTPNILTPYGLNATSTPTTIDTTNKRFYAYVGAWDYAPMVVGHTLTVSDSAVGHDVAILVNSGPNGQSIGGGGTAGLYVADPNAGGAANVAVDDYFFGQRLIGYTNLNLADLAVGVATGNTLRFQYLMDRVGGGTDAVNIDGATGTTTIGGSGGAALTVTPNAGGADVVLGAASRAAADTHGFAYMTSLAARPTGAPNAFSGAGVPFGIDLTTASGHALWVRNITGGQWEPIPTFISTAAAGAGAALIANLPAGFGTTAKWWLFKDATGTPTVIPYYQ
jgi:hypothetical protein